MIRILAQFEDATTAFAAIQGMAAASYNVEDLKLHAVRPDGSNPDIPVRERSFIGPGFIGGGVLGVIGGLVVGLTALPGAGNVFSTVAVGSGLGAAIGAAMGIGWWQVQIVKSAVPADATGFVVVVTVPEGRAPDARQHLERLGGTEATPRLLA